jgi:hypothetical protein
MEGDSLPCTKKHGNAPKGDWFANFCQLKPSSLRKSQVTDALFEFPKKNACRQTDALSATSVKKKHH